MAVDNCASPLRGGSFHEYTGPITDRTSVCFVCGQPPKYGIRAGVLGRPHGVCEAHMAYFPSNRTVKKQGLALPVIGAPNAEPEKPKTLEQTMAEFDNPEDWKTE